MSETCETAPAVTAYKVVNAPIEDVFDAWINPEKRRQWWAASPEHTCTICEIDAKIGGMYRLGMRKTGTDADWIVSGEFKTIDHPNHLQFSWCWDHDPDQSHSLVTVHFRTIDLEGEAATELKVVHEQLDHPVMRSDHNHGWVGCLHSLGLQFSTIPQCD